MILSIFRNNLISGFKLKNKYLFILKVLPTIKQHIILISPIIILLKYFFFLNYRTSIS